MDKYILRRVTYFVDDEKLVDPLSIRQEDITGLAHRVRQDKANLLRKDTRLEALVIWETGELGEFLVERILVHFKLWNVLQLLARVQLQTMCSTQSICMKFTKAIIVRLYL